MTTLPIPALARIAGPLTAAMLALAGCASQPERPAVPAPQKARAVAPAAALQPADFSAGLRCMDNLFADYGTRDISVIVEDLVDQSAQADGATREMLIAVVSSMTQRSRAIRLVASGADWTKTTSYLSDALKRDAFSVVPQYALRGAISRQDNAADSVLGLDLTMLSTQDMTVVPGIATRNSAVFSKTNGDTTGELRKFGHGFGVSAAGSAGRSQALRALVELASIELFGRLAKVPYWTCLGATDASAGVTAEIQDWYDALAAQPVEIIKYFQTQLRLRQVYQGPIDGAVNAQLKEAVARYREALGLSREPKVSLDFFKAYLGAEHHRLAVAPTPAPAPAAATQIASAPIAAPPSGPAYALPVTAAQSLPVAAPSPAPLNLRIQTANDVRQFARGEAIRLSIWPNRDAHVYCFLQDENRKITRFFPNRFQRDSRIRSGEGLQLPGAMRFEITMNKRGVDETVACFATERDVLAQLPASVNAGDFETLPLADLAQVKGAFTQAAGRPVAEESLLIRAK